MILSEAAIQYLESHQHDLPEAVLSQAYWQTIPASESILEIQDHILYEVRPNGEKRLIRDLRGLAG